MPVVNPESFGKLPRLDNKPGYRIVTPTKMKYMEADGSDIRVRRVRVYRQDGEPEETYLIDEMGVHFKDLPDVADDPEYLISLNSSPPEKK